MNRNICKNHKNLIDVYTGASFVWFMNRPNNRENGFGKYYLRTYFNNKKSINNIKNLNITNIKYN